MTYVDECSGQFAKEAMACQSLDNDEILNVRWATEDPNPTSKVAEKRRLEDMGREAITARMDPRIVDAMRAVRALEEGVELDDEEPMGEELSDEDVPGAKRRRLEYEGSNNTSEGSAVTPPPNVSEPPKPLGLLSADTLESLKYFTEIRQRSAQTNGAAKAAPVKPVAGLGLTGYGSDEDDD